MKYIFLVGAGNMGSRHLQALKAVKEPLSITVIDRSSESLSLAQTYFEGAKPENHSHHISYKTEIPTYDKPIDLVIVATRSDTRRYVIEQILEKNSCRFFLLEKLLFQKEKDYRAVGILFKKQGIKAWVNCRMRTIPCYQQMRQEKPFQKIVYQVGSGQLGLATSAIHFLDHVVYLTDCTDFTLDTTLLESKPIKSKRQGFLELAGTLTARFKNGSIIIITRYPSGDEPFVVSIMTESSAYIVRETDEKIWMTERKNDWKWREEEVIIPFQSIMTTWLVEEILQTGNCRAVTFDDSVKTHLQVLEPLRLFLNKHGENYDYYPFT